MRKSAFRLMIVLVGLLVFSLCAASWADNWVLLGTRVVALANDRDEVVVGASMGEFKAIKLRVVDAGVQFEKLVVVLSNGRIINEAIRDFIPAGESTRVIDLPGKERKIRKVIMHYTTRPGTLDRAQVEVWGLRD